MKKSLIIGIIVVIFIISILAIIGVVLTNYNKEKKPFGLFCSF